MDKIAKDIKDPDQLYSPSRWVVRTFPHGQDPVSQMVKSGFEVKENLVQQFPCELDVVYGNGKKTKMDIYYPKDYHNQTADVLIFLHGGYWQEASKDCYPFLGSHLINDLDCIFVMVGYDLAPDESIHGMVEQLKSAVVFTRKKFPSSRLFLIGHSAGAHLVASMMTQDWQNTDLATKPFTGVCLIGGIFDLEPLVPTYVNDVIKMDKEYAARCSPMKAVESSGVTVQCDVLIVISERDSPAFHEQSKDFFNLLKNKLPHHIVQYVEIPEVDHFDIMEKCVDKEFVLNKVVADFMKK